MLVNEQELREKLAAHLQQCTLKECMGFFPTSCEATVRAIRTNKRDKKGYYPYLPTVLRGIEDAGGAVLFKVTLPPIAPSPYLGIEKEVERMKVGGQLYRTDGGKWYLKQVGKSKAYEVPQDKVLKLVELPQMKVGGTGANTYTWNE